MTSDLSREEVGQRLKELREEAGLTRPTLGLVCAIDSSRLERIERGKAKVHANEIQFILGALDRLDLVAEMVPETEVLVLG